MAKALCGSPNTCRTSTSLSQRTKSTQLNIAEIANASGGEDAVEDAEALQGVVAREEAQNAVPVQIAATRPLQLLTQGRPRSAGRPPPSSRAEP